MDNLKLYEWSESDIKGLVSNVDVFRQAWNSILKSLVWLFLIEERLSQQTGYNCQVEKRQIGEDEYKYPGILEYDRVKEQEMKISSGMSISGGQNWFWRVNSMERIR